VVQSHEPNLSMPHQRNVDEIHTFEGNNSMDCNSEKDDTEEEIPS
jgi:hypothetical protein